MRGDGLAPPIISTYAVGDRARSPASAGGLRRLVLPAVAMLGTASAGALVWAWPETKTREGSGPLDGGENTSLAERTDSRSANSAAAPGFSFQIESSQFAANLLTSSASSNANPSQPAVHARAKAPARDDIRLAAPAPVPATQDRIPLVAPAYGCLPGCSGNQSDPADVGRRSGDLEVDPPSLAPLDGHLADASSPGNLATAAEAAGVPPIGVAAEKAPESDLRIDAVPAVLAGPAGEPTAAEAEADAPVDLETDLALGDAGVPAPEADKSETSSSAEQIEAEPIETIADSPAQRPSDAIALHLQRIGERYSSAPSAEPASVAEKPDGLPDRPADRPDAGAPVASTAMDAPTGGVILRDDALVAIELGALVSMFEDRLDRPLFVWLRSSATASKFATAETLAAAGIRTKYDPQRKQIVFSVEDD